jgi:Tfp pilus assembly protein PilX
MKRSTKRGEAGIALVSALLALMVLSAIGAALVFMTNTETQVNFNYRSEQVSYFAAKAGMEEARARMMTTDPNTINALLPTSVPSNSGGILYVLNEGNAPGTVQPWNAANAFMDDELCHDGYSINGLQTGVSPDVRCTAVPNGAAWYSTTTSTLPWNGTSAALPYKWVRIAQKLNGSIQNFPVNAGAALTQPVCWNGVSEVVLTAPTCAAMTPIATPVYLLTALAVGSTGARKMVQADVAVTPSQPSGGFGLFATGTGCGSVSLSGGATTDGWDSAHGGTYATTKNNTEGSVGSNGNVSMSGGVQVGGNLGASNTTVGACPDGITSSGGAGLVAGQNPPNQYQAVSPPLVIPTPPAPNPAPPVGNVTIHGNTSMVPGTYGDLKLSGGAVLTLSPGVYNLNSISLSGNSTVNISPAGQVTLNIAGSGAANAVDFSGGSVSNNTGVPNNFQVNYAGTGGVSVSGGSGSYIVVDAPNAAVKLTGNSDIFGAVVGKTIQNSGGVKFHVDFSARVGAIPPSGNYVLISFRHLVY